MGISWLWEKYNVKYNVDKKGMGKQCHLRYILCMYNTEAVGRILSGENGKGRDISGKKIKILTNRDGEEYQVAGNFIHHAWNWLVGSSKIGTTT